MSRFIYALFLLFLTQACWANNIIICPKGKISIGDSKVKIKKFCGDSIEHKGGSRSFGKNNVRMDYTNKKIKFSDGTVIRFVFFDDKLAFVLD